MAQVALLQVLAIWFNRLKGLVVALGHLAATSCSSASGACSRGGSELTHLSKRKDEWGLQEGGWPTMMPPTKASMYWRSKGVKNGLTNRRAMRAPNGSDNPCTASGQLRPPKTLIKRALCTAALAVTLSAVGNYYMLQRCSLCTMGATLCCAVLWRQSWRPMSHHASIMISCRAVVAIVTLIKERA